MKLSVVIPCYNEEKTIEEIDEKVLKFNLFERNNYLVMMIAYR